ncbi:fructosamine kinase family protein [Mucilaginibacter daejeonensis]|uniref:fructosamine kinase family protein n=1 Tax=Mucilaginibacter daejeonensis TaxID=398049 RepID=UPI001D170923|nr:fructosamine kinase family protein [Mucilaginibacter daejeonensis]UEG55052.1 fructosamine kinase family protein [Mucilaginibacter daejeonensis]
MQEELIKHILNCLTDHYQDDVKLLSIHPVTGGDINEAYCLDTSSGKLMMKLNSRSKYAEMFEREAQGLAAIRSSRTIAVPEVIIYGHHHDDSYLIMQWIESRRATREASKLLGIQLAAMHRNTASAFGFKHHNYMGSISQSNRRHYKWSEFFVQERLMPMVKIARNKSLLEEKDIADIEQLCQRLPQLFDEEAPALIHGDLWGGNYLISADGKPYLIDPAVSYGHREFDISMTTLFGGFERAFYDAYQDAFPLAQDWEERTDLWNLYPLLLHLNLFGLSYLGQVRSSIKRYL